MEKIDAKYLKGAKYKTSEGRKVNEDGRETTKYAVVERPMRQDDVLDWKDNGGNIVMVTADGQKLTVAKAPAKENPGKE